jgi:hypothetical protein
VGVGLGLGGAGEGTRAGLGSGSMSHSGRTRVGLDVALRPDSGRARCRTQVAWCGHETSVEVRSAASLARPGHGSDRDRPAPRGRAVRDEPGRARDRAARRQPGSPPGRRGRLEPRHTGERDRADPDPARGGRGTRRLPGEHLTRAADGGARTACVRAGDDVTGASRRRWRGEVAGATPRCRHLDRRGTPDRASRGADTERLWRGAGDDRVHHRPAP